MNDKQNAAVAVGRIKSDPPGSHYGLVLQKIRLLVTKSD